MNHRHELFRWLMTLVGLLLSALFRSFQIFSPPYNIFRKRSYKYMYIVICYSAVEYSVKQSHCCSARTLVDCLVACCSISNLFFILVYDNCSRRTSRWSSMFDKSFVSSVSPGRDMLCVVLVLNRLQRILFSRAVAQGVVDLLIVRKWQMRLTSWLAEMITYYVDMTLAWRHDSFARHAGQAFACK